jgi:hypothetical protein
MKTIGLLFSAPMALANVALLKTQTRRLLQAQPPDAYQIPQLKNGTITFHKDRPGDFPMWSQHLQSRFNPGDVIYQKETFFDARKWKHFPVFQNQPDIIHRATPDPFIGDHNWKPSIFMPREASRFTAEITEVRIQRLDQITEEDAEAEGVKPIIETEDPPAWMSTAPDTVGFVKHLDFITAYRTLWNTLHLPPAHIYGPKDPITKKRTILSYVSYPWSLDDFHQRYPNYTPGSHTWKGHRLHIIPNPFLYAITYKPTKP